jgi:3-hydroxyacyl-CoA dehydrogenase
MLAAGRDLARKTRRHLEAPVAAVDALEAAATLPFAEGCARERDIFFQLAKSEQAKALIHAFFAERGVSKVPGVSKDTVAAPVSRVGIIGAGTMGGGIAMACANAGISVRLTDTSQETLDRGIATIRKNYDVSVKRGRFTPAMVEERMKRISPQVSYDGLGDVDLVIEAVFENMALKKQIAGSVASLGKSEQVFATNTSTLDIDEIAAATGRAPSVLGLHFFSPANVMRLLEVVRGRATAPEVLATALALARTLRKVAVVSGVCDGFIGNRMLDAYVRQAWWLVEEGAMPWQVDQAIEGFGFAMGPFRVGDLVGHDVSQAIRERRRVERPDYRCSMLADELCRLGRLGQKTGGGWYDYPDGPRRPVPSPAAEALVTSHRAAQSIAPRAIGDQEIVDRLVYALVNEGARLLEEGIAARPGDIDVVYLTGYGFPRWRGGPMYYAEQVGLERVVARMRELRAAAQGDPEFWRPAPLLESRSAAG